MLTPARRELLEHLEQPAGGVVGQLGDDARLVGARALGQAQGAADEHEARHGVRVVADALGEHLEVVVVGDAGRRDRGFGERRVEQSRGGGHVDAEGMWPWLGSALSRKRRHCA